MAPLLPFSRFRLAGQLIITSGVGPFDPVTKSLVSRNFEDQARTTLSNLLHYIEEAGGTIETIQKTTCYLSDRSHYGDFNSIYQDFFRAVEVLPARTTVIASAPNPDVLVEIDALATKSAR